MINPILEIEKFQTDRSLHLQEYDALNEHASIIEELFESIGFNVPKENRNNLKTLWEETFEIAINKDIVTIESMSPEGILSEHEQVDAYNDIIVFAIGAIMKLGYNPTETLIETAKEINSRRGSMIDGKFEKDLSDEAKALWYKADFTNCKRRD